MHKHIMITRRPNRWPSSLLPRANSLSLILLLVLVVSGSDAIVKQQQQQQQQQSQPQQPQQAQPQQQRSDESQQAQASSNGQQVAPQQHQSSAANAYNNHKSPSLSSSAVPSSSQPSYSSSVSMSSSNNASPVSIGGPGSQQQASSGVSAQASAIGQQQQQQQQQQQSSPGNYANYGPQSAATNQGPKSYLDSMSAAASSNDQSYLAAANSVNQALANSGIFGSSSAFNSPSAGGGSQSQQQSAAPGSPQSLNPLHYFYYPAKENQQGAGIQAKAGQSQLDMLTNSASNNYQSLAYPSYTDQLNSALSSMGSGPEPSGSSQDPSYLPQPGSGMGDNGPQGSMGYNGAQQVGQQQQQPSQQSQQAQQNGPHQGYNGDLSGYNSNSQPQSVPAPQHNGGISFSGPSSGNQDYLNSHLGGGSAAQQQQQQQQLQQQQQVPPLSAYQNNLYNQLGDLSTSNFGNNAGGLASVASYMSPGQQDHSGQSGHDLFNAASLLGSSGQQFNSAASQLSPSAVSPPGNQQQQQQQQANQNNGPLGSSSLFNGVSSLFGNSQASNAAANSLFSNPQYLNSFLSSQQYNQLTGQQQQPSQLTDQISTAASSPATAVATGSSSSGKRFGISSFIMPMLAIAGLSLLIPTMSNIGTAVGRRKRSIQEDRLSGSSRQQQIAFEPLNGASQLAKEMSIGEYMDKIERYYSIYKNAVESDDCLNRLICEFGDAVKDVTGKSAVVTVIEKLVPTWMTGKVHLFKEAALDHKEGKEKCKKYVCHSNKHQ